MKNIIVGTAGHIDHGKTTLIRALTGRNTDRWEEEQRRGITIDLGFTWFDLPSGNRVGIIDVPGHEKFVNNMVAGVVGMDLVLLVIAADEGIMPQTREHVDILGLLGIEKCIIVLNKCDLVDEDWLEMVKEDIREELKGSFCESAPMAEVSSVTGAGEPDRAHGRGGGHPQGHRHHTPAAHRQGILHIRIRHHSYRHTYFRPNTQGGPA